MFYMSHAQKHVDYKVRKKKINITKYEKKNVFSTLVDNCNAP